MNTGKLSLFATTAMLLSSGGGAAFAQQSGAADASEIVVVGSQIRGASTTAALPVIVADEERIAASGAASGDELLRSIPQMGDVLFEAANNPQTSNSARGDVNSVNLRSLGVGNTLVLLNGRRIVQHPTSQGTSDTGTVPVLSYNSNAIPVSGLDRVEVLLDGAAAIYGADAVAGVINTVLRKNFDGLTVSTRYGGAEGTGLREFDADLFAGKTFDRGSVSLFVNYANRTELNSSDQDFTASDDMRPFFSKYPGYETSATPDGRASNAPWGQTSIAPTTNALRPAVGGVPLTTAAGAFHVQPASFGCVGVALANGLCLVSGTVAFSGVNRDMRYDTRNGTTVRPALQRGNAFLTGEYELGGQLTAFGELGYYRAKSEAIQPPVVNLNQIWIPASNYWNPFGPTTFANGQANPNRLANLTNVPAQGLPVLLGSYRYVDTGFQKVTVNNYQSRLLGGLRGQWGGFDWETALTYSEAEAEDISPNVNMTSLQRQLALSTPDAYNPFTGGCVSTPSFGDCTPSTQASINGIVFDMRRFSRTTLTMVDFKLNRNDLFNLPAGAVGVAFGGEYRRETQMDDRDANLDGSVSFTDAVSGARNLSNVAAVSPNPDTRGHRKVSAAFVEFAVPIVSSEMGIPLFHRVDMQLAGRYEDYSDFGSVAKPKVAVAWDILDGLRARGSYSEGFRAPNLEQVNATQYARLNTGTDYYRCEADLRAGRIANMNACTRSNSTSLLLSGNPQLEPEESTNQSFGLVLQPKFMPDSLGDFTFTVDRWKIEQEQIVGLLGAPAARAVDYLNRMQGGSNPNVVRAAPTSDDIALFAGTGLAPVGEITSISDRFINLLPQTVEGIDFGFTWSSPETPIGEFDVQVNTSKLLKFSRQPGPIVDGLYAARAARTINALTPLPDTTDLIAQNGRPEWKSFSAITWKAGNWRVNLSAQYVSEIEQPALLSASGDPWLVEDQLVFNGYVQYELRDAGFASNTRIRIGARDLGDQGPPLADGGYLGAVHPPYGRYWYIDLTKKF